jgi:radical SAM protein (TIGR01212 family)
MPDKPYYSLNKYFRQIYGQKVYKIALQGGLTCPNRDGTIDNRGCSFCSGGSGEFSLSIGSPDTGLYPNAESILKAAGEKHAGSPFAAYFQAFTNTYGDPAYLRSLYEFALQQSDIKGISIATRPDCISQSVLDLLCALRHKYHDKFIWIELGLQTIHESTAIRIRRGYTLPVFHACFQQLKEADIPVIVHVITGLPGESAEMLLETIKYLNRCKPFGIKLQLLHVLKGTDLANEYKKGDVKILTQEEYVHLTAHCLGSLSSDIVIHRVTGDGPKATTIAPLWSLDKKNVLNHLHRYMWDNSLCQGCFLH